MAATLSFHMSAQQKLVFAHEGSWAAAPIPSIDSIKIGKSPLFQIHFLNSTANIIADTIFLNKAISDTLFVRFDDNSVRIQNPHLDYIQTQIRNNDVFVSTKEKKPFVCMATGYSSNGRLVIDSDTTFTLRLSDLSLFSTKASAISLTKKQKVRIELAEGTVNTLSDATSYQPDCTDSSNGCLYSRGSLIFADKGTLYVTGNYRHAITSGKNITVKEGRLIINDTKKDGLHCNKFMMEGGRIELHLSDDATKGIKCKEDFVISNGIIDGEAAGNIISENASPSYCSLVKVNGNMTMKHGAIKLRHDGTGGRCISVDGDLIITGGTLELENHGNGGYYLTIEKELDYFTPKCITVNGTTYIERGHLHLIATGSGGKGVDCSDTPYIGR